ncbi:MAG: hypothetical protein JWO67_2900 [Streptosporangiaceae bacterium]|nr:hypothetical protein [Streptosporangiaceae bacterium]
MTDANINVAVRLTFASAGAVELDDVGLLRFPRLPDAPAIYRLELASQVGSRVYVGQAARLRRRVNGYRNPGPPSQTTNNRMNPVLCQHLEAGENVTISWATVAEMTCGNHTAALNLADSFDRTLAESAAVVAARAAGETLLNVVKVGAIELSG